MGRKKPNLRNLQIRARNRNDALKRIRKFQRDRGYTVTKVSLKGKRRVKGSLDYIWEKVNIWSRKRKK